MAETSEPARFTVGGWVRYVNNEGVRGDSWAARVDRIFEVAKVIVGSVDGALTLGLIDGDRELPYHCAGLRCVPAEPPGLEAQP